MKKLVIIFTLALALSACSFLDVVPTGRVTFDDMFATHIQANQYECTIFYNMPDQVNLQYSLNIAGADLITPYYRGPEKHPYKSMIYNNVETPSSTYVDYWCHTGSYPSGASTYTIWEGVRVAYDVLEYAATVPDATQDEINQWIGDSYFMIAWFHQLILDYYGPTVIVDHKVGLNEDCNWPRSTYEECVNFISDMYDAAVEYLPETQLASYYGRPTKTAALLQKARLWLTYASPLINGNTEFYSTLVGKDPQTGEMVNLIPQTYDPELWKKAMDVAQEAIEHGEANGYGLLEANTVVDTDAERGYDNMRYAFVGNGSQYTFNNTEILFGSGYQESIRYNQLHYCPRTQYDPGEYSEDGWRGSLVPTLAAVENFFTEKGLPWEDDPDTKGHDRYELVEVETGEFDEDGNAICDTIPFMHTMLEPRFQAWVGYDRGKCEVDGSTIKLYLRYNEENGLCPASQANPAGGPDYDIQQYYSSTGYICKKWSSEADTYTRSTKGLIYARYYWPFIRMAEAYLDYAEAEAEYTGSLTTGLVYINKVRNRAGLPNFEDAWAEAGGMPTGEKLIQVIRQERMNEFAFEGRWYFDLRRWKIAEDYYANTPKALNIEGVSAEDFNTVTDYNEGSRVRAFQTPRNYWKAVPQTQININPDLVQNPGYTGSAYGDTSVEID